MNNNINNYQYFLNQYNSPLENKRKSIKKACSKIGFMIVIATIVMNIIGIIMEFILIAQGKVDLTMKTGIYGIPYIPMYLLNAFGEFSGFFIIPFLFCLINKFRVRDAIPFNNNKKYNVFAMMIAGYSICVLANFAVSLLDINLSIFGFENSVGFEFGADTLTDKIVYFTCVAIVPALTEEFTFRGVILNYLRKYGDGFAVLVSSILFGLVHGNLVQIPFAFIVGLVCGYITIKTGTILPSVLLHLLNNGTSVLLDIAMKSVDNNTAELISNGGMCLLMIISFITVVILVVKKGLDVKFNTTENEFSDIQPLDKVRCFLSNAGIITAIVIFSLSAFFTASSGILQSVQQ